MQDANGGPNGPNKADSGLDSITGRKVVFHAQASFCSKFRASAMALWSGTVQRDSPNRVLDQRDVESQFQQFQKPPDDHHPLGNDSLSAFPQLKAPVNNHAPSVVAAGPSVVSDAPLPFDESFSMPPPAFITDMPTVGAFNPSQEVCDQCWISYPYAQVYYPSAEASNTECLKSLTAAPEPNLPPLELDLQPGFAYIVLPEISAKTNCKVFTTFTSQTFSFAPHQLSTIQGPQNITKEFDFGDLPCPPPELASEVQWFYNPAFNPSRRYSPFIAPFTAIYDLDPRFKSLSCRVALNQGMDPATAVSTANGPSLPGAQLHPARLRRRKDILEGAHRVPSLPLETESPLTGRR
ncbi:MAG: hypothetical protein Q9168_006432 [Polycauliona sp. 1 TL-2023]